MISGPYAQGAWLDAIHPLEPNEVEPLAWLWGAFFGSDAGVELIDRLSQWLPSKDFGHGPSNDLERRLPTGWPKGLSFRYARVEQAYFNASALAIFNATGPVELQAVVPLLQRLDVRHNLTIRRVHLWPDQLQAEIEATFGDRELTFYDTSWMSYFHHYAVGRTFGFSLVGLAWSVRKIDPEPIEVIEPGWLDAVLEKGIEMPFEINEQGQRVVITETKGMAALLADSDGPCHCSFRGTVKELRPLPDLFGQPAWLAVVTVGSAIVNKLHPDADELDLDIVFTRLVWGDGPLPVPGDDLEGRLWLQGSLTAL